MSKLLHYAVTVRDSRGNLFKMDSGAVVLSFKFTDDTKEENIEAICRTEAQKYETISPNSRIDIEVRYCNKISNTYPSLYSYYHTEKRFVKH